MPVEVAEKWRFVTATKISVGIQIRICRWPVIHGHGEAPLAVGGGPIGQRRAVACTSDAAARERQAPEQLRASRAASVRRPARAKTRARLKRASWKSGPPRPPAAGRRCRRRDDPRQTGRCRGWRGPPGCRVRRARRHAASAVPRRAGAPRPGTAQPEVGIGRRHLGGDRRLEVRDRIAASVRLDEDVAEAKVGLRVGRIGGEDLAQRCFERRPLELARDHGRQPRGNGPSILGVGPRRGTRAATSRTRSRAPAVARARRDRWPHAPDRAPLTSSGRPARSARLLAACRSTRCRVFRRCHFGGRRARAAAPRCTCSPATAAPGADSSRSRGAERTIRRRGRVPGDWRRRWPARD